jgi:hypothetical protein
LGGILVAEKKYKLLKNFKGVNRHISKRDAIDVLQTLENMDSNLVDGMLISRKGSTVKQSSGATPNIDKFVMFRDEAWAKDVLLVYDKDATAADRKIYVYTRTSETDNSFAPHSTASYAYGSLRFEDQLTFMVHRNGARIGTGTAAANKAMFAGYIDRSIDSEHDAMFNDQIAFNDFFLTKQQFVQQETLFNIGTKLIYDSTREKYYVLTGTGLEIRDSDFYVEKVLVDAQAWRNSDGAYLGNICLDGSNLYVLGQPPTGALDTILLFYDLDNDFVISTNTPSITAAGEYYNFMTCDGNFVYVTYTTGSNAYIVEFTLDLSTSNNRYTAGSADTLYGITYDGTNVYAVDQTNQDIVRMLKVAPYTPDTFGASLSGLLDIEHYSGNLYYNNDSTVYLTDTAGFVTKTLKYTRDIASSSLKTISILSGVPYVFDETFGRYIVFDGVADFNEAGFMPRKICGTAYSLSTSQGNFNYYYAFSLIDIYGQESHLILGVTDNGGTIPNNYVKIIVAADSENFHSEITSPSADPTSVTSIWNEFRKIKKIRVWRAYSDAGEDGPTTDYTLLEEIDINDADWTEATNNELYTFTLYDTTDQADISTVTYEESSGLPEAFKPYYTNWQYGINYQDRYYYGNVRTDELNAHEIIETPINAPDAAYQHDQNIDYFYPDDGDEIKGFAQVWSRMVIFKGNNTAIYSGLSQETMYDIGTSAPDSILIHNNIVYFIFGTGIYNLTPSGYERISEPIDPLLSSLTLTGVSGVKFKEKQKLWWLVPQGDSFCFNYNKGTWDVYDIQSGTRDVVFIGQGLDDTIFTSDQFNDSIYKENTGNNDGGAGNPIQISVITNDIALGDGYLNAILTRLFLTATSTDNIALKVYWENENGNSNTTKTFTATASLKTLKKFLSSIWGGHVKFEITQNITAEVKIDAIGFEYFLAGEIQDAS